MTENSEGNVANAVQTRRPPRWNVEWVTPAAIVGVVALPFAIGPFAAVLIVTGAVLLYRLFEYSHAHTALRLVRTDYPALILLFVFAATATYLVVTQATSTSPSRPDEIRAASDQIAGLRADVQLDLFIRVLGPPPLENPVGTYTESVWRKHLFLVQTITTGSRKVVAYSVTTLTPKLRPTYEVCGTTSRGRVSMGGRFPPMSREYPPAIFGVGTAYDQVYSEIYGGAGYCDFQYQVLSFNSVGLGAGSRGDATLGEITSRYTPAGVGFETGLQSSAYALLQDEKDAVSVASDPAFQQLRSQLIVNTVTVTYPDVRGTLFSDLGQDYFDHVRLTFGPHRLDLANLRPG